MTAAPMMMRPSVEPSRERSESTRAVMPTDVAVRAAPMKTAAVETVVGSPMPCGTLDQ